MSNIYTMNKDGHEYFVYKTDRLIYTNKLENIISFERQGRYVNVTSLNAETVNISCTLNSLLNLLTCRNFVMVNRGTIVNFAHVNRLRGMCVITEKELKYEVSRPRLKYVKSRLLKQIISD